MPKLDEKKVLVKGACTVPPSLKAANRRLASASLDTVSDSANPSNLGLPVQRPSEARIVLSPTRKLACITLFSLPGGVQPGCGGSGLSLNRIIMITWAPIALR